MFTECRPFPGITHITDAMGVSFTLIEGEDSALLFDAGYGLEDVAGYVRSLTDKPVELILSHGHHDHVLGARWFDHSLMDPADLEEFRLRTARAQREAVRGQALEKGLHVPEDFLAGEIPLPEPLKYIDVAGDFDCSVFDLGSREVWAIRVPGHTAGSIVLFVPDVHLLLTGDDWNPCTWMWFPCSLPVRQWHGNMIRLLAVLEQEGSLRHVLCSHQPNLRDASELKEFLAYITEDRILSAPAVDMGNPIHTRQVFCPEKNWVLIFDGDK